MHDPPGLSICSSVRHLSTLDITPFHLARILSNGIW
jgi:hypothetical protein